MFRDRTEAGRLLAEKLQLYRPERPIVLALTRGGVPVGFEVARRLDCDFDVMVVRKIADPSAPQHPVGALAEGGEPYVDPDAVRRGAAMPWIAKAVERERAELARRAQAYRGARPMPDIAGRTVIVTDDGVATGATARAAGRAARQRGAARVVLAVPVIAVAAEPQLRSEFDAIMAIDHADVFFAVGQWYERFAQVTDDEVAEYVRRAAGPDGSPDREEIELSVPVDR